MKVKNYFIRTGPLVFYLCGHTMKSDTIKNSPYLKVDVLHAIRRQTLTVMRAKIITYIGEMNVFAILKTLPYKFGSRSPSSAFLTITASACS